mgnify:CR=1 FL=1
MTKEQLKNTILDCLDDQGVKTVFLFEPRDGKMTPCLRFLDGGSGTQKAVTLPIYPVRDLPKEVLDRSLDVVSEWMHVHSPTVHVQLEMTFDIEVEGET